MESMLSDILAFMRCPRCTHAPLEEDAAGLVCTHCNARYPLKQGILDMVGDESKEIITPFQRLMQAPAIVSIYEKIWRRIGYYLASSRSFSQEMQTVLAHGKNRGPQRTLDLACGPGVFTRPLARQGQGLVIGLDLSWPMLRRAQQQLTGEGIKNILLIRASAFALPFTDAAFPYVNCCGALHLFDRPENALSEIRRIVSPEGFLCVQTTIRPNRSAGFAFFLERFIRFGFFGEPELLEMINNNGFAVVQSERHRISYTFLAQKNS